MFDWNSPVLISTLLIIFFLLLHLVIKILAKADGKKSTAKFALLWAVACFFLRVMFLEMQEKPYDKNATLFVFLLPILLLGIIGLGDLILTIVYRIFHIDEMLDEQSSNPNALNEQGSVSRPFLYNRKWDQYGK